MSQFLHKLRVWRMQSSGDHAVWSSKIDSLRALFSFWWCPVTAWDGLRDIQHGVRTKTGPETLKYGYKAS